eukprot:g8014.t1
MHPEKTRSEHRATPMLLFPPPSEKNTTNSNFLAPNLPTKHGICRTHCPGKAANPSGDLRAPSPAKAYLGYFVRYDQA